MIQAQPHFNLSKPAPALLGFDDKKDLFCAHYMGHHGMEPPKGKITEWCVGSNFNVMSLGLSNRDSVTPTHNRNRIWDAQGYNTCRHFEWLMCAAKGLLPGQNGSNAIRFASAPQHVVIEA